MLLIRRPLAGVIVGVLSAASFVSAVPCSAASSVSPPTTQAEDLGDLTHAFDGLVQWVFTEIPADVEAAIRQAVQDVFEAHHACGMDPKRCDPARYYAANSEALKFMREFITTLRRRNYRLSPDRRGSRVVVHHVEVRSKSEAKADVCVFDADVVLGKPLPDGSRPILNDETSSYSAVLILELQGDRWLLAADQNHQKLGKEDRC